MPGRPQLCTPNTLIALLLLAACHREPPVQLPPSAQLPPPADAVVALAKPSIATRTAAWPDPLAKVAGTAIAKNEVVGDLEAAVHGGTLAADADDVTLLRTAATALEARIDAAVVAAAIGQDAPKAQAAFDTLLAREVAQAGGRERWQKVLASRGISEASHLRTLRTEAQLHVLVEAQTPFTVTDDELQERYAEQAKALIAPAAVQVLEVAEALPVTPTGQQLAAAQARVSEAVKAEKWPTTAQRWQTPRELGPERWAAVAALQPGETTGLLRTPFGVHRLKLVARRAEHKLTFAEAKQQLAAYLQRLKWVRLDGILLAKLRADAKVQRFAPFDNPPGGLPLAGAVTMAEFEEEED